MLHRARSWWLDEAGGVDDPAPPLDGDVSADVVVVGGGYTGMWTAWHLLDRGARVVLLEADLCGHGPSGRNGGFCEDLSLSLPWLVELFGDDDAQTLARRSEASVDAIEAWCETEGVDAWFVRGGQVVVDELGGAEVDRAEKQATVQPARLALGLRRRLLERGTAIHEHTRVRHVFDDGVQTTGGHRVRARHVVLAAGGALAAFAPLRNRITVASSHIVLTEPVPDLLDEIGWTDGSAITDDLRLLHYTRTTNDGRIAFGWAGGRLAMGARLNGRIEVDAAPVEQARKDLVAWIPQLAGRRMTHAWGGPIDVSPSHLPAMGSLDSGTVHYAVGYTGNGVGPSHFAGEALANRVAGDPDDLPLLDYDTGRVPPEPWRWIGGTAVAHALRRVESGRGGPLSRALAELPDRMGMTLGR